VFTKHVTPDSGDILEGYFLPEDGRIVHDIRSEKREKRLLSEEM
jgi:hypothetical protein